MSFSEKVAAEIRKIPCYSFNAKIIIKVYVFRIKEFNLISLKSK